MQLDSDAIQALPQRYRAQLINCLPGFKPAVLVGTADSEGRSNLAIISSLFHIGANPPLLGMILRPDPPGTERHTLNNILTTGHYTLNALRNADVARGHQTAARYPADASEFDRCGFTPLKLANHTAPAVKESPIRIGCVLREHQQLSINQTHLLIGEIVQLSVPDESVREDGSIDLARLELAAVAGLDSYHPVSSGVQLPYPKPD